MFREEVGSTASKRESVIRRSDLKKYPDELRSDSTLVHLGMT
jgi:hypothetical protein